MTPFEIWLNELGLEQYFGVFAENDVDFDVIAELSESDLEKLGISLGHRKKLIREISKLNNRSGGGLAEPGNDRPLTAEFRYLSVMFCDLVGSTALTAKLGAEDMREINRTYQQTCRDIIEPLNGYVARYMGDGVMVYFGFPKAQEDAAERAIRAGLGIVGAMTKLNQGIAGEMEVELSVRIGVASGRVVVDHIGVGESEESNAVGEAPNLAARMQGLAQPNGIVIDKDSKQLAGGVFEYRDIGQRRLKGVPELTQAWEVLKESGLESRFQAAHGAGMGTFVGRDDELDLLLSGWRKTIQGEGQVRILSAEGGLGKSRIIEEFLEKISDQKYLPFRTYCSPYQTQNPMYPVTERLRRQANLRPTDSPKQTQQKLEKILLKKYDFPKEVLNVFASLMALELNESDSRSDLTPAQQLSTVQDALIHHLISSSKTQPVLVLLEDAHWVDPTTAKLFDALVEKARTVSIYILISARPENCPDYKGLPHVSTLALNRLSENQVVSMINDIAQDSGLDPDTVASIQEKCDGVPLFVEEITKMIMDTNNAQGDLHHSAQAPVPNTLQASLLARLDKLGAAKEIAQIASVVGDRVSVEIMSILSGYAIPLVEHKLEDLVKHDILDRRNATAGIRYEFRHALLRDAAYSSLLNATQKNIHSKIADYLCQQDKESNAGLIAFHYSSAADSDNAFKYWLLAGINALETGATLEAVGLLDNAKKYIPSGDEKDTLAQVYHLHINRGHALNAAYGAASTDAHDSFRAAVKVSEALHNIDLQVDALDWEFGITFNAGMLEDSIKPAQVLKQIGETHNHVIATISGYQDIGMAHFSMGDFDLAKRALENGLKYKNEHVSGVTCYPSMSLNYLSNVQYITGDIEQARKTCDAALASARNESIRSTAAALNNSCYVLVFLGETETVKTYADELIELSERKGQYMYTNRGLFFKHWAAATIHSDAGNLTHIVQAVDALLSSREEIDLTFFLGMLAELQIFFAGYESAQSTLDTALSIADKNHEHFYLAELYRLRGVLAALNDPGSSEPLKLLDQAISIAHSQNAASWENRAVKEKDMHLAKFH